MSTCVEDVRQVIEGLQLQGITEAITYTIDTTPWGGAPTAPSVKVYAGIAQEDDVTATRMPSGSAQVTTNTITLPQLRAGVRGEVNRVVVTFTSGASIRSMYFDVLWMP